MFEDHRTNAIALFNANAFPKNRKLKTDEISSVFNFKHRINAEYLSFLVKANTSQTARLAVIVSKKIIRDAVRRNYCKRVIRELFRVRQKQLSGMDLVVQVRKGFSSAQFENAVAEFDTLLSRLPRSS